MTYSILGNRPTARPSVSALDSYGAPLAPPLSNDSKENDISGVIIAKSNPTVIGIKKSPKASDSRPTYFNYVPPLEDTKPKVVKTLVVVVSINICPSEQSCDQHS